MKLTILASGSKANAAVLECNGNKILVDAGLSVAQLEARMVRGNIKPQEIDAIVLTHEHADHSVGAPRFSSKYNVPVYASILTAEAMRGSGIGERFRIFVEGMDFWIKGFNIYSFEVWHDAADPVGFVFSHQEEQSKCLAFATDLGRAHAGMIQACQLATTIFLEANYAQVMIEADKTRPWSVRERIMSFNGHLSNENAAAAVSVLPGLKKVVLGHLSAATNHPEVALSTVRTALAGRTPEVEVAVAFIPEKDRCRPPLEFEIL